MELNIYTDGSWDKTKKHGGWAYLIVTPENKAENNGFSPKTTNNIMELTAILEALSFVKHSILPKGYTFSKIIIHSDSRYCVNSFSRENIILYNETDALSKNSYLKNKTHLKYITQLINSIKIPIRFKHVAGHSNDSYNDYVDRKAVSARFDGERKLKEYQSMSK